MSSGPLPLPSEEDAPTVENPVPEKSPGEMLIEALQNGNYELVESLIVGGAFLAAFSSISFPTSLSSGLFDPTTFLPPHLCLTLPSLLLNLQRLFPRC